MNDDTYLEMGVEAKAAYHLGRAQLLLLLMPGRPLSVNVRIELEQATQHCSPNRYPDLYAEALALLADLHHRETHP